jgi:hypothetical protein
MTVGKGEKPILSVRIDQELLDRVDELAVLADVGRAEVVERCLWIGVVNQEELVSNLRSPLAGSVVRLLSHPAILKAVGIVLRDSDWADPTTVKLSAGVKKSLKGSSVRAKEA